MTESHRQPGVDKVQHRLRLFVSDSRLDNALWNMSPEEDMAHPLHLFSIRSFVPEDEDPLQVSKYKHSINMLQGERFMFKRVSMAKMTGAIALKFLVHFGHERAARIITEPLVRDEDKTIDEQNSDLTFLYDLALPIDAKRASIAAKQVLNLAGQQRMLGHLSLVSDENPFVISQQPLPPERKLIEVDQT